MNLNRVLDAHPRLGGFVGTGQKVFTSPRGRRALPVVLAEFQILGVSSIVWEAIGVGLGDHESADHLVANLEFGQHLVERLP